jgi:hypothetical protein
MNKPNFPVYGNFDAARSQGCFLCLSPLKDAPVTDEFDYPQGRGKWAMRCADCECWTFFDIGRK